MEKSNCERCEMNLPIMPDNAIVTRFSLDGMNDEERQIFDRLNTILSLNGGIPWSKLNEILESSQQKEKDSGTPIERGASSKDARASLNNLCAPEETDWESIERNKMLLSKGIEILDNRSGNQFNEGCVAMPIILDFPLIASQIGGIKDPENPTDEEQKRIQQYVFGLISPEDILLSKGICSNSQVK